MTRSDGTTGRPWIRISGGPAAGSRPWRRPGYSLASLLLAALLSASPGLAKPSSPRLHDPSPGGGNPETIRLSVQIVDGSSGQPTAARIRVIGSHGRDVYPLPRESHFYHEAYSGHRYFYADGDFTVDVPPGRTQLWISKGFEFWSYQSTFDLPASQPTSSRTATLTRFADLRPLGWRSGDTHVHINHDGDDTYQVGRSDVFMMQRAEDTHVVNLLEDPGEFTGVIDPVSTPEYLLYLGGEYRSAFWGHMDVLGVTTMPYLFCCSTGQPAWPMNVDLVRDARNRGGMAFFAHPITIPQSQMGITDAGWPYVGHGRELPIDVALGTLDALDIYSYSNLNRIEFQLWYDLLNHGFRIPAAAGTDASVNRTTDPMLGGYRVYAQVGNGAWNHPQWLEAVRSGRSFVTNGPLIRNFQVGEGVPGSVLTRTANEAYSIPVTYDIVSQWPIQYAALVVNGSYQRILTPTGDKRTLVGTTTANVYGKSGWVALFVYAPWLNPGTFFTFGSLLYAHSSPVYVDVAGAPLKFGGADPTYYVRWIDEAWQLADDRGWDNSAQRDSVLSRVTLARSIMLARTTAGSAPEIPDPTTPGGGVAPAPTPSVRVEAAGRRIRFRFVDAPGAPETFDLFDIQGRALCTRRLPQDEVSREGWSWEPGVLAPRPAAGVYFARFRGSGWSAGTRVTIH